MGLDCQPYLKNIVDNLRNLWHTGPATWKRRWLLWKKQKRVTGKKGLFSSRDMVLCALFAAILAVSAWLTVPGEVPFTLQTFGVFAALGLLGGKRGDHCHCPVFGAGRCGSAGIFRIPGRLRRPLGYHRWVHLWLLLSGLLYWALTALLGNKGWVRLLAMVLGLLLCYAAGTGWFLLVYLQKPAQSLWVWCWPNALSLSCCRTQSTHPSLAPLPPAGPACSLRAMCPAGPKPAAPVYNVGLLAIRVCSGGRPGRILRREADDMLPS